MDRRSFLTRSLAGAGALSLPGLFPGCSGGANGKRPNILFCIADDQSYPHAGIYGCDFVRTPAFNSVAREGALFHNTFVSTPSCCPSRGSVLTGQAFYRLREASMNHTVWPAGGPDCYPGILAAAGYEAGYTGKGWGPGNWKVAGLQHNPAGPAFNDIKLTPPGEHIESIDYAGNFEAFLKQKDAGSPFCFWTGFVEPHRPYDPGIGVDHGMDLSKIEVPGFYPDANEIRTDIADYAFEIEHYDRHLGRMLMILQESGELDNTLIVVTADNGMPFPRAKATLYDYGVRMPMAIRWGDRIKPGRVVEDFVSFTDFAPTFMEAAGLTVPDDMTGRSLMPVLTAEESGQIDPARDHAVFGIERHFPGSRPNGAGYPMRGIRTKDFLYIHNYTPDATPVGDHPGTSWPEGEPVGGYGDTDGGLTKTYLWEQRNEHKTLFDAAFGMRPGEELYDVIGDPFDLNNLAADPAYAARKAELAERLQRRLETTEDPRATGNAQHFDEIMRRYPVLGSNQ